MKLLLVGGGGREHALAWKLSQSNKLTKLYCAPGNAGIAELAECIDIKSDDIERMCDFAKKEAIDLVLVAPDDPLAMGMVDAMQARGIAAFGPNKAAARIEASKSFAKDLMKKYDIPTANYAVFSDYSKAKEYLKQCEFPLVVKADGLALGKGVLICQNCEEAESALKSCFCDKTFGDAGNTVLIEEFLEGPEMSILAFADGTYITPMLSAQDHKRVFDHDQGPNTGGMGTFAPSPRLTPEIDDFFREKIMWPTLRAMENEACPFSGVLYFGLMLTKDGPKVIEYNARFGDPETQVILPLLKTDLIDVMLAVIDGKLEQQKIDWDDGAAVCVVLASGGYPGKYKTGLPIHGLEKLKDKKDILVFQAGTKKDDDETYLTAGGRVLGIVGLGDDLNEASQIAYAAVDEISFEGMHYRSDISKGK